MNRETYEKASKIVSRIDEIVKELTRIRSFLLEYERHTLINVLGAKLVVKVREGTNTAWREYEEEFELTGKDLIECLTDRANRLEEIYQKEITAFDNL